MDMDLAEVDDIIDPADDDWMDHFRKRGGENG
jgi:hypothetical protein